MKKTLLLILSLLLFAVPALATENWVYLLTNQTMLVYLDSSRVTQDDKGNYTYFIKYVPKDAATQRAASENLMVHGEKLRPEEFSHMEIEFLLPTGTRQERGLAVNFFDLKGQNIFRLNKAECGEKFYKDLTISGYRALIAALKKAQE
ncbi:MAG TPA: hypothetical protein DD435_08225 [Cyanobacteria bacterium UBA8530]|nr:hypothetical protein [Cyanobacteria bacterium UBA8530]